MSFFDNARHSKFIKYAEKQENASRFIGFFFDRLSVAKEPTPAQSTISLIARSPASPVARAVLAAASECQAPGVRFEVLFCRAEPAEQMSQWLELVARGAASNTVLQLRRACHPAIADAHEQMVLGTNFSWLGDSMRRDPETRDAFETFECFNPPIAQRIDRTFQVLWPKGEKLTAVHRVMAASGTELLPAGVLNVLPGTQGPSASTRH